MDLWIVVLLGAVQGLTEFLPISSDGHLAIVEAAVEAARGVKLPDLLGLNITLHAGTWLATLVVYRRQVLRLLTQDRRVLGLLAVGTAPAAAAGFALHRWGGEWLTDPLLAGCMLPLTGLALWWGARRPVGETDYPHLGYGAALAIGCAQALALLPGISRSGMTIASGLGLGLRRDAAATFSFLLALPAIAGACVLEGASALGESRPATPWPLLVVGTAVSFAVGLAALRWLLRWLETGRLHLFAWWCVALGLVVVAWQVALLL
jgi:undecaprenyl-diphosphatase